MSNISLSEFADRLQEIIPVIMREFSRRQSNELSSGRITLQQFLVLEYLFKKSESRMTDLARFMEITTAAMTGIADRLVRNSYIARFFNANDRRVVNIKLTLKGQELVKKINLQRRHMIMKIFSKISFQDRQDYLRILTQIKEVLAKGDKVSK